MRKFVNFLVVSSVGLIASSAFAQAAESAGDSKGLAAIGAALAIGIGAFGAASAQGKAASATLEGITRNPASKSEVFTPFLLGLAFMEFQAILSFLIAIQLVG